MEEGGEGEGKGEQEAKESWEITEIEFSKQTSNLPFTPLDGVLLGKAVAEAENILVRWSGDHGGGRDADGWQQFLGALVNTKSLRTLNLHGKQYCNGPKLKIHANETQQVSKSSDLC